MISLFKEQMLSIVHQVQAIWRNSKVKVFEIYFDLLNIWAEDVDIRSFFIFFEVEIFKIFENIWELLCQFLLNCLWI